MRNAAIFLVLALTVSGCTVNIYKGTPKDKVTIEVLRNEVDRLAELREKERQEFEKIKAELELKLNGEGVGLELQDRGLVISLADNILFDSGKAKLKEAANPTLDKIAVVVKTSALKKNIGIEGHTDNEPIKYSGWRSNRELSTARANNVYHYLIDQGVDPSRITTMGYGEYRPITANDTAEGRAKNRRVEIVILPEYSKESPVEKKEDDKDVK